MAEGAGDYCAVRLYVPAFKICSLIGSVFNMTNFKTMPSSGSRVIYLRPVHSVVHFCQCSKEIHWRSKLENNLQTIE